MTQILSLDTFWARYGHKEYEETDFARALERLPKIKPSGPWLAGGSVRRLLVNQPQDTDFDFFFKDQAQFDEFCGSMKSLGASVLNENDFNITFTVPSVAAKPIGEDEFSPAGPELKVQAIRIAFYGTVEETVDSFDFSICQAAFDGNRLILGDWTLFDLANKRLVPGQIRYGTSSLRRMIKYTRQGFTVCSGGLADMLEQVVNNPEIIQQNVEYID